MIKTTIVPVPEPVAQLRKIIAAVDAPLIATPEYDGSVLGQLKNAIDGPSARVLAQAATRVLGRLIAPLATKRHASQRTKLQTQTDTQWNAANTTP